VFLKVDADQNRTDVEGEAMAMASVPTPEILWRKPPVLALAAVPVLEAPHSASQGGQPARPEGPGVDQVLVKLKLDLHDLYNRGDEIDRALRAVIDEAVRTKATLVEIIPGKGSGQLKKRVLRFLDQKEVKVLYHRVEKDSDNFGRVFVHFRWKKASR
jgi:hypothetical protein